jgi:hypothetical protein
MGYRSDLIGLIYGTDEAIDALLARQTMTHGKNIWDYFHHGDEEKPKALQRFERTVTRYESGGEYRAYASRLTFLRLQGEGWKWYDGYDCVHAWSQATALVEQMAEEGLDISYEFVRIGEEAEDIVEDFGGADPQCYARVRREIVDNTEGETEA